MRFYTSSHIHISKHPGGNDILSFADFSREDELPYFTLSYANGKGYNEHFNDTARINPTDMNFDADDFRQPSLVPLEEATHEGSDVGVYATGVNAHLFTGVYEQHYIAHAMMYATCLGPENFLKTPSCYNSAPTTAAAVKFSITFMITFSCSHFMATALM